MPSDSVIITESIFTTITLFSGVDHVVHRFTDILARQKLV